MGAGQLSADCRRGVGVLTKIGGHKDGLLKTAAVPEAPQRRFKAVHHIATAANGRDWAIAVTTPRQIKDPGLLQPAAIAVAREDRLFALPGQGTLDHPPEQHTSLQALTGAMGGAGAVDTGLIQLVGAVMEKPSEPAPGA